MILLVAGLVASAKADITLYQDTFSRGSTGAPQVIDGSSPDTTVGLYGAAAGAVYSNVATDLHIGAGSTSWTTDGNKLTVTNTPDYLDSWVYLPFVPQAGNVYTMSVNADVAQQNNSAIWSGFGVAGTTPKDTGMGTWDAGAWGGSQGSYPIPGPGLTGADWNVMYAGGAHTYSTVLDTTGAQWKASWKIDGVQQGATWTYSTTPTIDSLFLLGCNAYNPLAASLDNYTLSVTHVPEPSTAVLLVTGIVGLLAYARRNRK
jgi:hypothetical protein